MTYREEFVKKFGELFASDGAREHYESHGVEKMELDETTDIVTITFRDGTQTRVNVAMDSLSAMAYDIIKNGLW